MSIEPRQPRRYVYALGVRWLNRSFDPLLRMTMRDARFKAALLEQARIGRGQRVLDLGCGTGTLLLMLQRTRPEVNATGIDGDASILALAAVKGRRAGGRVRLVAALADQLPFPPGRFDRVVSTLLFHHLNGPTKRAALGECFRVLRPGGELHVADWGQPHARAMHLLSMAVHWIDGVDTTADNFAGRLPTFIREAGFEDAAEACRRPTMFGTLSFYCGRKPTADAPLHRVSDSRVEHS